MLIATKSRPNCPTQMNSPTATTTVQRTSGRGTKNTAGRATNPKRRAAKRSGGNDSRPISMTTKFTAQQIATTSARTACRRGISVTHWSSGDDSAREQSSHRSFRMTRRGRVPARPTNGVCTVDEQRHLGSQVGVFQARLGEELVNESLPSAQMRQRGLTNGMAWAVDLERCVDERASSLRFRAERVLDHIEERQDHQLAGLAGATSRVRLEAKECASVSVVERFGDEPILGAELLVQRPLRHPCPGRDRAHPCARDAVLISQLARRPDARGGRM